MGLSTHILDTAVGKPAANVSLTLSRLESEGWVGVGHGATDHDGRCKTLLGDAALAAATYKIRFATAEYFAAQGVSALYPYVEIVFQVLEPDAHYHIPLLLTANGYTTYRGS